MNDVFAHILFPLSIGGVGGFLIGYALKKVIKVFLVFFGLYLLSLYCLVYVEVIRVNNEKLFETFSSLLTYAVGFIPNTLAYLPISGSFALGFTLGIVKG
jgi:uncharacterized membrane protein (Fun14 family)